MKRLRILTLMASFVFVPLIVSAEIATSPASGGCNGESVAGAQDVVAQDMIQSEDQARIRVLEFLESEGQADFSIDGIQSIGGLFVVQVSGSTEQGQYQSEFFVRQDGAVITVNDISANGKPGEQVVNSKKWASVLAKAWLVKVKGLQMQVGEVYPTESSYVIDIESAAKPSDRINQLIVRKDGVLLPVYETLFAKRDTYKVQAIDGKDAVMEIYKAIQELIGDILGPWDAGAGGGGPGGDAGSGGSSSGGSSSGGGSSGGAGGNGGGIDIGGVIPDSSLLPEDYCDPIYNSSDTQCWCGHHCQEHCMFSSDDDCFVNCFDACMAPC